MNTNTLTHLLPAPLLEAMQRAAGLRLLGAPESQVVGVLSEAAGTLDHQAAADVLAKLQAEDVSGAINSLYGVIVNTPQGPEQAKLWGELNQLLAVRTQLIELLLQHLSPAQPAAEPPAPPEVSKESAHMNQRHATLSDRLAMAEAFAPGKVEWHFAPGTATAVIEDAMAESRMNGILSTRESAHALGAPDSVIEAGPEVASAYVARAQIRRLLGLRVDPEAITREACTAVLLANVEEKARALTQAAKADLSADNAALVRERVTVLTESIDDLSVAAAALRRHPQVHGAAIGEFQNAVSNWQRRKVQLLAALDEPGRPRPGLVPPQTESAGHRLQEAMRRHNTDNSLDVPEVAWPSEWRHLRRKLVQEKPTTPMTLREVLQRFQAQLKETLAVGVIRDTDDKPAFDFELAESADEIAEREGSYVGPLIIESERAFAGATAD